LIFKYHTGYLGTQLSRAERASIVIDHYAFLRNRVKPAFFRSIVDGRLELWRRLCGDRLYRICLTFPRTYHDEGDLALILQLDQVDFYTLSFTIGPGNVAGVAACRALYIARVQGKGRALDLIRRATKDCLDVSPAALLLAAAEGVATALDLQDMIGIGAYNQISAGIDPGPENLFKPYDEFWIASGGVRLPRDMYHLAVPLPAKPIQTIKRNHRARVLHKRAFKKVVKGQVCSAFRELALRACDHQPARVAPSACSALALGSNSEHETAPRRWQEVMHSAPKAALRWVLDEAAARRKRRRGSDCKM
jgi:hypothetical protein